MSFVLVIAVFVFICIGLICVAFEPLEKNADIPAYLKQEPKKGNYTQHTYGRDVPDDNNGARDALKVQAERMARKGSNIAESGITYFEWLTECIKHLRTLWHDCSYDDAKTIIEESLDFWSMKYPSNEYEWDLQSARDFAVEISHDGESFGDNS